MKKSIKITVLSIFVAFNVFSNELSTSASGTDLAGANYKVVKRDVTGVSVGFFLAFLFGATPNRTYAIDRLISDAQIIKGHRALINFYVYRQYIVTPIGLFIVDRARADVIEFDGDTSNVLNDETEIFDKLFYRDSNTVLTEGIKTLDVMSDVDSDKVSNNQEKKISVSEKGATTINKSQNVDYCSRDIKGRIVSKTGSLPAFASPSVKGIKIFEFMEDEEFGYVAILNDFYLICKNGVIGFVPTIWLKEIEKNEDEEIPNNILNQDE